MLLYLDASACVRLYIREPNHERVWSAVQEASQTASHLIGYTEMRAALARMHRMARLNDTELATIKKLSSRTGATFSRSSQSRP